MKNLNTFEEFLNEAYTRKFGNFLVALSKEKINHLWLDEMSSVSVGIVKMIEHFGKTPHRDICVIREKDNKNFDKVRSLTREFGVTSLFGLDTKDGRFCVINSNT
jgi:hypothetical protein